MSFRQLIALGWILVLAGLSACADSDFLKPTLEKHDPYGPLSEIRTKDDYSRWVTYYYLYPRPALTEQGLKIAEKNGTLAKAAKPQMAFFAFLFAYNPTLLPGWVKQIETMDKPSQEVLCQALWCAALPAARSYSREIAKSVGGDLKSTIDQAANFGVGNFMTMPIRTASELDMLWASFFYTGDARYVERIIDSLGQSKIATTDARQKLENLTVETAAAWSLSSNARQHRKVMAILVRARDTKSNLRDKIDTVLAQARR